MHGLARNQTTVYYALFKSKSEIVDSNGNKTGQYRLSYSSPVALSANVRWDSGAVEFAGFGLSGNAQRRMIVCDPNCPITIDTVLWIGITPDSNGYDGQITPNYVVAGAPERSLNQAAYLLQEVNISCDPLPST